MGAQQGIRAERHLAVLGIRHRRDALDGQRQRFVGQRAQHQTAGPSRRDIGDLAFRHLQLDPEVVQRANQLLPNQPGIATGQAFTIGH